MCSYSSVTIDSDLVVILCRGGEETSEDLFADPDSLSLGARFSRGRDYEPVEVPLSYLLICDFLLRASICEMLPMASCREGGISAMCSPRLSGSIWLSNVSIKLVRGRLLSEY